MCPVNALCIKGRPRDSKREDAIAEAAISLIQEVGYERCTIEAIALKAGVSKATIYRRWKNKQEVIANAISHHAFSQTPSINTGNLRDDLVELLLAKVKVLKGPDGAVIASIMSAAKMDSELAKAIPHSVRDGEIQVHEVILERAIKRGEISLNANLELLAEITPAIMTYRIFMSQQPVNRKFIEALVDDVLIPSARKSNK
ncbi:MAG: TetR/AcrR family transcriptional regulator [Candidatus Planktophila sp.]|nr:TetR/AcrR family transcriptional regulator [Candidatus Planktophila sp.]